MRLALEQGRSLRLQVTSGSMRPWLRPGDAVQVAPVSPAEVRPGDLLVFLGSAHWLVHRVIGLHPLRTKGDALLQPDPEPPSPPLGRVTHLVRSGQVISLHRPPWPRWNRRLARLSAWEARTAPHWPLWARRLQHRGLFLVRALGFWAAARQTSSSWQSEEA